MKFVVCLEKQDLGDFSNEDITVGRLYELIEEDAGNGMVRVIDESGEDYLYPSSWFEPIALRDSTAIRLHDVLTRRSRNQTRGWLEKLARRKSGPTH